MFMHLTARALPGYKPMLDPITAWWLMWRLRLAFPTVLAACVMPDHLHLIAALAYASDARARLARVLSRMAVRAGLRHLFERVPEPQVVPNGAHLERQLRYVHLNPCRAKLVSDPLAWPWSTHRGLVGAEANPWVSAESLAQALGRKADDVATWLHRYVSADPSVSPTGSPCPAPCPPRAVPTVPLDVVRRAALSATPWSSPSERRAAIVTLASEQGWRDQVAVARAAGLTPRSVRRLMSAPGDAVSARPSQICLADRRLLLPDALIHPISRRPR